MHDKEGVLTSALLEATRGESGLLVWLEYCHAQAQVRFFIGSSPKRTMKNEVQIFYDEKSGKSRNTVTKPACMQA